MIPIFILLKSLSSRFSPTGHLILARDYLNMTVWDIRNSKEPISISPVHDYIKPLLPKLRDNDCVYDKFDICASCDGNKVFCGSYRYEISIVYSLLFNKNVYFDYWVIAIGLQSLIKMDM